METTDTYFASRAHREEAEAAVGEARLGDDNLQTDPALHLRRRRRRRRRRAVGLRATSEQNKYFSS